LTRGNTLSPEDVLGINVFEAPEMNRDVRVSATAKSLCHGRRGCGRRFTHRLETALEELLHQKYMKDPHVACCADMQSHPFP